MSVLAVTSLALVPFVEHGQQLSAECLTVLHDILNPVVTQGADYLVLGCTHYPFLKDAIQVLFADQLTLIDSGFAVARQTARILIKHELLCEEQCKRPHVQLNCYVSGQNAETLRSVVARLIDPAFTWDIQNIAM